MLNRKQQLRFLLSTLMALSTGPVASADPTPTTGAPPSCITSGSCTTTYMGSGRLDSNGVMGVNVQVANTCGTCGCRPVVISPATPGYIIFQLTDGGTGQYSQVWQFVLGAECFHRFAPVYCYTGEFVALAVIPPSWGTPACGPKPPTRGPRSIKTVGGVLGRLSKVMETTLEFKAPEGWSVAWSRAEDPETFLLDGVTSGGSFLADTATPRLRIIDPVASDAGDYILWVAPPGGFLEVGDVCTVIVDLVVPAILSQPQSREACESGSTVFEIAATGASSYMWSRFGVPLSDGPLPSGGGTVSGAGTPSLTISGLTPDADGFFDCIAIGPDGGAGTYEAELKVSTNTLPPIITQQPVPATVCPGETITLTLAADAATPDGIVAYQWRKDGVPIVDDGRVVGANWPGLEITEATSALDAGIYDCVLTQACGEVTTIAVGLFVGPRGDTNSSGAVDFDDITEALANWGAAANPFSPGDANGDGQVTFDDITEILANWGQACA